jgi:four helix bundle protein
MRIDSAKQLTVYVKAYELSMRIFRHSEQWPRCEQFALTGQIRRSSRSICLNFREAWAKRRYENHFVSKLTDCDGEANETDTALDFARDCGYLTADEHRELTALCDEVRRMLGGMLAKPETFAIADR